MMISSGKPIRDEPQDELRREPTNEHMQSIDPLQAKRLFGSLAKRIEGTSVRLTSL